MSTENVRLTHEQMRIVKHKAGPEEVIKIVAFAGVCYSCQAEVPVLDCLYIIQEKEDLT